MGIERIPARQGWDEGPPCLLPRDTRAPRYELGVKPHTDRHVAATKGRRKPRFGSHGVPRGMSDPLHVVAAEGQSCPEVRARSPCVCPLAPAVSCPLSRTRNAALRADPVPRRTVGARRWVAAAAAHGAPRTAWSRCGATRDGTAVNSFRLSEPATGVTSTPCDRTPSAPRTHGASKLEGRMMRAS